MAGTVTESQALSALEAASLQIRKQMTSDKGGQKAEIAYSEAYQRCVSLGLKPQVRRRYR